MQLPCTLVYPVAMATRILAETMAVASGFLAVLTAYSTGGTAAAVLTFAGQLLAAR